MASITPHIEMMVKVIYSFKSVIYPGDGETKPYSKTLDSAPGMFTSLKEIQEYIEECEQKRLGLDNEGVWSKAYLPTTRTTELIANYQSKVKSNQIHVLAYDKNSQWLFTIKNFLRYIAIAVKESKSKLQICVIWKNMPKRSNLKFPMFLKDMAKTSIWNEIGGIWNFDWTHRVKGAVTKDNDDLN